MPPRVEQEYEKRRQQIIDGALHVFAKKGFEKATNKEIAAAAGIRSAGLIYHYFKDKADLLRAVVEQRAHILQFINQSDQFLEREPRDFLTMFATIFLETLENRTAISVFKLLLSESIHKPALAKLFAQIGPGRGLTMLTRYLEYQMEKGVLRRMDPGAAARSFIGPLLAYMLTREVFPLTDAHRLGPELMAQTAVEIFLQGTFTDIAAAKALE